MKKTILFAFAVFMFAFNNVSADTWRVIHENIGQGTVNDGVLLDGFKLLVAVGDSGMVYKVMDDGYWEGYPVTGTANNLQAVDQAYNTQNSTHTIIAVSSNGTVVRSLDSAKTWNDVQIGTYNFRAIKYSAQDNLWFIGGDNGVVYYSDNFGTDWSASNLSDTALNVKGFVDAGIHGFFLFATKNDSTFILQKNVGAPTFGPAAVDAIPDEIFTDAFYSLGTTEEAIYFCGGNAGNTESNIYKKTYNTPLSKFGPAVEIYNSIPPGVTSIDGYQTPEYKTVMWVAVDNWIYKSNGNDQSWKKVYTNFGNHLKTIVANPLAYQYGDYAYALGRDELFLSYGFRLDMILPDNNRQFDFGVDHIEIVFSSIPQLASVQNAIALHSSISGDLPVTSRYDNSDSTRILVNFTRPQGDEGTVPGEHLTFTITKPMQELGGSNSKTFKMKREWDILSFNDSQIDYSSAYQSMPIGERTTNFVTGFFNDDDVFDIITYSNNKIHCYKGNIGGPFDGDSTISLGISTTVDSTLHNQLLTYDINNDGKLDLILFDKNGIQLFENVSNGQNIYFYVRSQYNGNGILQVAVEDFNNNGIPDLRVMTDDSFFALEDVNFSSFPGPTLINGDYENFPIMKLGDIDNDGWNDAVLSDENQSIIFMRGGFNLDFLNETFEPSDGRFIDIQLADFNRDGLLEVAALTQNKIYIYKMDMYYWSFSPIILSPQGGENLTGLVLQEFGGTKNNNSERLMDIAVSTQDGKVIFFENQSMDTTLVFNQDTSFTVKTALIPSGIGQADFDADALIDPIVFNQKDGQFEIITNAASSWAPVIYEAFVENENNVRLSWSALPPEMGELEYYTIIRDTTPQFDPQSSYFKQYTTTDTFFTDTDAYGNNTYWYSVNAVYDRDMQSQWAMPVMVEKSIPLSGNIVGFLDRANVPYLVKDFIRVPIDSSLIINPGVKIAFMPGARFDVEGHLEVIGAPFKPIDGGDTSEDGDDMVSFSPADWEQPWQGIYLYPSAGDTIHFEWFNIERAHVGITIDNRPASFKLGSISGNDTGLVAINDSLTLQNVMYDSNKVAMVLESNTRSFMKNINLMNSMETGLYANYNSKTFIKNAIIWDNNNRSIYSEVGMNEDLHIAYSTIDTVIGMYSAFNNIKSPPVFMPPDSGDWRPDYSSPTIDAGDPSDDFGMEPVPNGGRINQGLFGGTPYATRSALQTNLFFEPGYVFLQADANFTDTAFVKLTNTSDDIIHINAAYLKNAQPQFALFNISQGDIPAQGSIEFYITFSPDHKGRYLDSLVIDSNDPLAPVQFLPIEGTGLNTPPILGVEHESLFAVTNEQFSHRIPVYDIDDDQLVYTIEDGPQWLSVTTDGVLSGMPAAQDTGYNYVRVKIEDGSPYSEVFYSADIEVISSDQLLSGAVSGVLDSTSSPYIARSNIYVPDGETLQIEENTKVVFFPNTQLDIYGSLELNGRFDEIIEFNPFNHDSLWNGIKIHQGADTLNLQGFVVFGSDTALSSQGRTLNIRSCGLINSKIGISLNSSSAKMENVYIDSVGLGITISQSNIDIKNLTVINSKFGGINIAAGSDVRLRNGILWNNPVSITSAVTAEHLSLSYSTIDNIQGNYTGFKLSNLAPVMTPPIDGPSLIEPSSPTIDAGDPMDDYSLEPEPNGGRINQGAFGGTAFATPSFQGRIVLSPDTLHAAAFPGESDTLLISVRNAGGEMLDIQAITFTQSLPEFTILGSMPPYSVSPSDSIIIPVRFTPQNRQEYLDTLIITSNDPHYINGQRLAPLSGTGLNHAPVIIGNAPPQVRVENEYNYKIRVFDAEGDDIVFSPVQLPAWLALSDSGAIRGTPALSDTGINHVEISVNDGHGGSAAFIHDIMVWITDDYAPRVVITSQPPSKVREAAVHFEYYPDDTTGYLVGDEQEQLFMHYRLISLSEQTVINEADSIKETSLTFYPLDDGNYEFQIWAYDTHGNGLYGVNKQKILFNVSSSKATMHRLRWYMVSLPRAQKFNLKKLNEDSTAIILRWSNEEEGYLPPENFEVSMGEAFWIQSFKPYDFDLSAVEQTSPQDTVYTPIEAGWNQVGIPLGYKVNWSEMYFVSDSTGERLPLTDVLESKAVYWYLQNKQFQGYVWEKPDTSIAYPWRGYWIKSTQKGTLIFPKQPAVRMQSVQDSLAAVKKSALAKTTVSSWQLNLTLSNDNYIDNGNIIGISNTGKNDLIYEPPHFGEYCSLYFMDAKGKLTQKLKSAFESYEDVISWDFQVKSSETGKQHLLKWDNEQLNTLSLYVYLIDPENEEIIDMDSENSYTFILGSSKKTFKVYATQDASFKPKIVPLEFKLLQNYPNPFNPSTTIRFGVPESLNNKKISVKVFDILGREIVTLLDEKMEMGYHEVKWNGKNSSNIPAASGIYFYQVKGGSHLLVKKMILMR